MWKMAMTMKEESYIEECGRRNVEEFLAGDPAAALKRLVELRSGAASDQSDPSTKEGNNDIENTQQEFTWVYRYFCTSLKEVSGFRDVKRYLLTSHAIEFILKELNSKAFRKYKSEFPSKSQTAAVTSLLKQN